MHKMRNVAAKRYGFLFYIVQTPCKIHIKPCKTMLFKHCKILAKPCLRGGGGEGKAKKKKNKRNEGER